MIDALFGSKTRVKLLHLFLNNPNRAFYVREITRKIDEQINSVRRELANMLSIGIIKSDSANNKLYYEVNTTYTHYSALKDIFADGDTHTDVSARSDAGNWASRLKPLGDLRVVLLSGGLVKGSSSDVDLLLVGEVNKPQAKRLIKELEEDENHTLNYAIMPYEDFYYRLSVKDRFVTQILNGKYSLILDTENILNDGQKE
jgi:hypothetical protein